MSFCLVKPKIESLTTLPALHKCHLCVFCPSIFSTPESTPHFGASSSDGFLTFPWRQRAEKEKHNCSSSVCFPPHWPQGAVASPFHNLKTWKSCTKVRLFTVCVSVTREKTPRMKSSWLTSPPSTKSSTQSLPVPNGARCFCVLSYLFRNSNNLFTFQKNDGSHNWYNSH